MLHTYMYKVTYDAAHKLQNLQMEDCAADEDEQTITSLSSQILSIPRLRLNSTSSNSGVADQHFSESTVADEMVSAGGGRATARPQSARPSSERHALLEAGERPGGTKARPATARARIAGEVALFLTFMRK